MNNQERIEKYGEQDTLARLVRCVRDFGAYHRSYCCYTTLDRVVQMMGANFHRLWLTRLDAGLFDDGIEHTKYGLKSERERTYIKSFMYGIQESAAMWGLYCPPTYKAIRMDITQKAMNTLLQAEVYRVRKNKNSNVSCKVRDIVVSDILYAAVEDEEHEGARSNLLFWNGVYSKHLKRLKEEKGLKCATGLVKDAEWRFENECRLVCKTTRNCGEHIAVDLPQEFFKGISFVLSPWACKKKREFIQKQLLECYSNVEMDNVDDKKVFRRSKLEKGLRQWAEKRGLD